MHLDDYEDDSFDDGPQRERPIWWPVAAAFELCVAVVVNSFGALTEGCEWFAHRVGASLAIAFMPWRWFDRPDTAGDEPDADRFNPETNTVAGKINEFGFYIVAPVFGAIYWIWESAGEIAERMMPRQIFWPLYWGVDVLSMAYDFFGEWWYSRDFRKLLSATPAIGLAVLLGGSGALGFLNSNDKKIKRYMASLATTEESKDAEGSSLLKQKLAQLGFEQLDRVEYFNALSLADEKKFDEAFTLMQALAPQDAPGLLEAHLWIAGALLDGLITSKSDPWGLIDSHVKQALSLDDDNRLAKRFAVEVMVHKGQIDEAMTEMESLSSSYPELHGALANAYHQRGELEKARLHARKTIARYQQAREKRNKQRRKEAKSTTEQDELLTPIGYLRLAESYHLVGDFDAELALLEVAAEQHPNLNNFRSVLIKAQVSQLKRLRSVDNEFTTLVESICRHDPDNKEVIGLLLRGIVATEDSRIPDAETLSTSTWKLIEHLEKEELLSSLVFQYAGDFYLMQDKDEKASSFYARSCKLDPQASFAWNNLAAIWSKTPSKLQNAMRASNRAIALNPDPRFYDTRGQIHFKLKQFESAIKDLESAVSGSIPNAEDAHRSLIKSYEALGQQEQADAHRSLLSSFPRN